MGFVPGMSSIYNYWLRDSIKNLTNMCDYYKTTTSPAFREWVSPGLEGLGQSNNFEVKNKLRELYANTTNSILYKIYGTTFPGSNATSMLPGHRAASQQLDQLIASISSYWLIGRTHISIIFNPNQSRQREILV